MTNQKTTIIAALISLLCTNTQVLAQYSGSPVPGKSSSNVSQRINPYGSEAPAPGKFVAPKPVAKSSRISIGNGGPINKPGKASIQSLYEKLPLTVEDAKSRLTELENQLSLYNQTKQVAKPQLKNQIYSIAEWLNDVANAHWKMYKAFDKSAKTKAQAKSERQIALAFSNLKNRSKLLKAELFILQKRYPEALQPLVDIVVQEPSSETGKKAYQKLVDLGFSKKVDNLEIAASKTKSSSTKKK